MTTAAEPGTQVGLGTGLALFTPRFVVGRLQIAGPSGWVFVANLEPKRRNSVCGPSLCLA